MDKLAAIKVFLQVVRAGSFVRAAEQADLSQTSASRLVRELEEAVGVRLLNRSTRSLSLTDAGEKLFAFYGQVIEELESIEAEASGANGIGAARLRVALPHFRDTTARCSNMPVSRGASLCGFGNSIGRLANGSDP